ncbi:MAG: glycosyltransferase [Bacteroidetes bacterium]|nr:glycosyltransferase [Bacteroidota bacterium]
MKFYILCKNESANIRKCIESLLQCKMDVYVYDSGSSDDTLNIIQQYPVTLVSYNYTNHCNAYNDITLNDSEGFCGIIDADMELTLPLSEEIYRLREHSEVLISPIKMYVDGFPLDYGSLCPPKPIIFRNGKTYFESVGHGERLISGVTVAYTQSELIHNDLKPYLSYLDTQIRYADNLMKRATQGQLTWRDRVRLTTPLLILVTPLYSLLIRGGIFSKKGWIYAIDRLIAEAIMYRRNIVETIKKHTSE